MHQINASALALGIKKAIAPNAIEAIPANTSSHSLVITLRSRTAAKISRMAGGKSTLFHESCTCSCAKVGLVLLESLGLVSGSQWEQKGRLRKIGNLFNCSVSGELDAECFSFTHQKTPFAVNHGFKFLSCAPRGDRNI